MEQVRLFFMANDVGADKEVCRFFSVWLELMRNLVAPTTPKDKSLAEIEEVLKNHFEPKTLV